MDITVMLSILGIAVTAAVSAVALKKYSPETSVLIAVAAGVVIMFRIISEVSPIIEEINSFIDISKTNTQELSSMMVGRNINFHVEKKEANPGNAVLEIKNLSVSSTSVVITPLLSRR